MAFPNVSWPAVVNAFSQFIQANGSEITVTLRDGVTTFTLRGAKKHRPDEALTAGLEQQGFRVSVMSADWDAGAGRPPEKGDQIDLDGRRHAIQESNSVSAGNSVFGYNLRVLG